MNQILDTQILASMTRIDNLTLELVEERELLDDLFEQIEIEQILDDNYEMLVALG